MRFPEIPGAILGVQKSGSQNQQKRFLISCQSLVMFHDANFAYTYYKDPSLTINRQDKMRSRNLETPNPGDFGSGWSRCPGVVQTYGPSTEPKFRPTRLFDGASEATGLIPGSRGIGPDG